MSLRSVLCVVAILFWLPLPLNAQEETILTEAPAYVISDNSFLLEEAYNQEAGVVQHVNTFEYDMDAGDWLYEFSQEWPLSGTVHQLSYSVPVSRVSTPTSTASSLGDITIDYRFQPESIVDPNFALAPRLSVILPTGNAKKGSGAGGLGVEAGLPASVYLLEDLRSHTNMSVTFFPNTKAGEIESSILSFGLGQSLVWLAHRHFNVLLEALWENEQVSSDDLATTSESVFIVNPGIRWSHDFDSGLQIVPGISAPITMTSDESEVGLFFYLSFEHSF